MIAKSMIIEVIEKVADMFKNDKHTDKGDVVNDFRDNRPKKKSTAEDGVHQQRKVTEYFQRTDTRLVVESLKRKRQEETKMKPALDDTEPYCLTGKKFKGEQKLQKYLKSSGRSVTSSKTASEKVVSDRSVKPLKLKSKPLKSQTSKSKSIKEYFLQKPSTAKSSKISSFAGAEETNDSSGPTTSTPIEDTNRDNAEEGNRARGRVRERDYWLRRAELDLIRERSRS